MATLTLTTEEIIQVRLLMGARFTANDLSDDQIRSQVVLGACSDYVFEKVREGLDFDKLTDTERAIAERFRDETEDDIANFVNQVLKPPQVAAFRRAVMYRCAGVSVRLVKHVTSEDASDIRQEIQEQKIAEMETNLFQMSDNDILLIRKSFPDDAFPDVTRRKYKFFAVTRC